MRFPTTPRRRVIAGAVLATLLPLPALAASGPGGQSTSTQATVTRTLLDALRSPASEAEGRPVQAAPRRKSPEDRYAMAGGCYVLRSIATGKYVGRSDTGFSVSAPAVAAEHFRFQALDLGKYLLFGGRTEFLAADRGPNPDGVRPGTDLVQGTVNGLIDERLDPVRDPVVDGITGLENATDPIATLGGGSDAVLAATAPSAAAEWVVKPGGKGTYTLQLAVDDHDIANPGPLDPAIAATLTAAPDGRLVVVDGADGGAAAKFALTSVTGCAAWPEIGTNVTGPHATASSSYAESSGFIDGHLHLMAFEFLGGRVICGRPWHPYGVQYALVDCPDHSGGGYGAVLEQFLSATPGGHDTVGWPTFGYWPKYNSMTHEQGYYKWLERAWRGGLRMYTNLLVENGALCQAYPLKKNRCNEMDAVRLQMQRLHELERYVDAQFGGPGEGWFRIVKDPFQARRVVNAGKLAVVPGIEVSVPLDCGEVLEVPTCTAAQVDERLTEVYNLGVRQMELTNKFDNGFTGVTGDEGAFGVLVNDVGNRYLTGHTWKMETCKEPEGHGEHDHRHDKQQLNPTDDAGGVIPRDGIFGAVLQVSGTSGVSPIYPAGPHCNTIGLSELGRTAIDGLIKRGMIFDPDHMSAIGRKAAIEHVTARKYSGVFSSHSWGDDPTYKAIQHLGGVVTPSDGSSAGFVKDWRLLRSFADPRFVFGLGYGSDITGFSSQGPPRNPAENNDVDYPFNGLGGAVIDRQVSGLQTYDVNTDGVDHYGLYPDWIEDARVLAGKDGAKFKADVYRSAEAYLQMWERAIGVPGNACRGDLADLSGERVRRVDVGMTAERVLVELGQPESRVGRTFTFCGTQGRVQVRFSSTGRVTSVGLA